MVALGGTFQADPNNVQGEYTPVPVGDYKVMVKDSDMKPTSNGRGNYIQLDLEIIEGEHAGRTIIERLNIDNPNEKAVEIAQRTLNAICVAVGKMSIADTNELHNIPMIAVVKVDPPRPYMKDGVEQPGSPSNSIKTYKPASAAVATAVPATASPFGGATASAAPASPPWKRAAAA